MQKITPHLWFDTEAKEAAHFYVSIFPSARITHESVVRGTPSGDCDILNFELAGAPFMAISAGPLFKVNPSISFHVKCATNEEVDALWAKLSDGGMVMMPLGKYPFSERFGWVQDRFGISWQIVSAAGQPFTQAITPVLMFAGTNAGKAEAAMELYTSVFPNASGQVMARYGEEEAPEVPGTVKYEHFSLSGQDFGAMDSARDHQFNFSEAISFIIPCESQEEIDYYWEKLSAVPEAEQCGWCKDRFGVSWQVWPVALGKMMASDNPAKAAAVTQAFLGMKKFDIAALQAAYDNA